jgi:hypothetical protein
VCGLVASFFLLGLLSQFQQEGFVAFDLLLQLQEAEQKSFGGGRAPRNIDVDLVRAKVGIGVRLQIEEGSQRL